MIAAVLGLIPSIDHADASTTVYIRSDGSIDPVTAKIRTDDMVGYTLTGDMTYPIVIERDGITLDGDGHTLRGTGYYHGVSLVGVSGVTVTGMDISGFGEGVYVYQCSDVIISLSLIHDNVYTGALIIQSSAATVDSNDFARNGRNGLEMYQTEDSVVSGNMALDNYRAGFATRLLTGVEVEGNIAQGNSYEGFDITGHGITLADNTATESGYSGFSIACTDSVVSGNHAEEADATGFTVTGSDGTLFSDNVAQGCKVGFELFMASNTTLRGNSFDGCVYGFGVDGDPWWTFMQDVDVSNTVDGRPILYLVSEEGLDIGPDDGVDASYLALVSCSQVTVQGLGLRGNLQGALVAHSDNCTIGGCDISYNRDGVHVFESRDVGISSNTIMGNQFCGIESVASPNCTFTDNRVNGTESCVPLKGILLWGCPGSVVEGNYVAWGEHGVVVKSSEDCLFDGNRVSSNSRSGFSIEASAGCTVTGNRIDKNSVGILCSGLGGRAYHNDFMSNMDHVDKPVLGTAYLELDNGYPAGGNFYSDYEGVDLKSGAYQDQPGSDGIGDTTHVILLGVFQDRYPLMTPANPYELPVASFTITPAEGNEGTLFTFNASASYDPENPTECLLYRWDWEGDGVWDTDWSDLPTESRVFETNGTFGVILQVLNSDLMYGTHTVTLTVAPEAQDDDDQDDGDDTETWSQGAVPPLAVVGLVAAAVAATGASAYLLRRRGGKGRGDNPGPPE